MSATIRPATLDDVPALVELLAEFVAGSVYGRLAAADPGSVAATCRGLIERVEGALFVAVSDGVVVGAIGGVTAPAHWNGSLLTAAELFLWVRPAYRQGAGRHLLDELRVWASSCGAGALFMSALEEHPRVGALYRRMGFAQTERMYVEAL